MRTTASALLWLSSYSLLAKATSYSTDETYDGEWKLRLAGVSGVHAMQIAVVDDDNVLIVDKYENNPLKVNGHPAWGAVYRISTSTVRPLDLQSNSFCAGGSWLSNGTMVNIGGDPRSTKYTVDGTDGIRLFDPCENSDKCDMYENSNIKLDTKRWYPTTIRLSDGSVFIMGGSFDGNYMNTAKINNPTIEYYPRKNIAGSKGKSIKSQFLIDTMNANLFPIVVLLPDDKIFVAANQGAMIYDWQTHTERRLPNIPNGVRVTYPMTGSAMLLPLTPENGYTPEILICGGSTASDKDTSGNSLSSQIPASAQCSRMVLTERGIAEGWKVEYMPEPRMMPDMVLMPGGEILIVNGAKTGVAGYDNVSKRVGASNADNPNYKAVLYRPDAPAGRRFSSAGIPASNIPRVYHSVATLLPSGEVFISGSNPNYDVTTRHYPTEYRVERLSPPYMFKPRPVLEWLPSRISYGGLILISVDLPWWTRESDLSVSLHDLGFVTHSLHMSARMVGLKVVSLTFDGKLLGVQGPPSPQIYPPGPAWLYVIANGIPSAGKKLLVGHSEDPPVYEPPTPPSTATSSLPITVKPLPQTTGTGVWQSTASSTTIFITTASMSGKCGAAFGTRTVCETPVATCKTKTGAGHSVCSAPLTIPTALAPITTGTGVWQSTASSTTIQITTASVNNRCGAQFGTRTVCQTPLASCKTKSGAGISTCSPAATQAPLAPRMTAHRASHQKFRL